MEDESGAKSYEDARKQRLLENKRKLEELGLEKLSKGLSDMKKLEEKPKRQLGRPKGPKTTNNYAVEPRRSSRARNAVSPYRDNMDSKFAIYWSHGGKFLELEDSLLYKWGSRRMQSGLDLDRIGYWDLLDEVKKMGYDLKKMCYKVPGVHIMYAMREIKDDKQVMEMVHHIKKRKSKFIEVFLEGQDQDEFDAFVEQTCKKFDEEEAERVVSEGGEAEANDPNFERPVKVTKKRGRPRKNPIDETGGIVAATGQSKRGRPRKDAGPSGGGGAGPSGGERPSGGTEPNGGGGAAPSGGAGPIFDEEEAERGVSEGGEAEANDPNFQSPVKVIKSGRPRENPIDETGEIVAATGQRKRGRPRKDA